MFTRPGIVSIPLIDAEPVKIAVAHHADDHRAAVRAFPPSASPEITSMQRALTSTPPTRARPPQPPPDDANLPNAAAEVSCHAHHEASTQNPYQRALTLKLRAEFKPIPKPSGRSEIPVSTHVPTTPNTLAP